MSIINRPKKSKISTDYGLWLWVYVISGKLLKIMIDENVVKK